MADQAAAPDGSGDSPSPAQLEEIAVTRPEDTAHARAAHGRKGHSVWLLSLGSVGVVFGDIGTSPLYAFREALKAAADNGVTRPEVLGVVSLALWALILVVTVKYVLLLMRMDNKGEGGVLSLMALAQRAIGRRTLLLFVIGVAGAALFYGDAIITPAVSVLSAVEGLGAIPALEGRINTQVVLSIAAVLLVLLFAVQSRGTAKVANVFGPICTVWFLVMAVLGVMHLSDDLEVISAFNPYYGVRLLATEGLTGFFVLGAVFLTVTGTEALIADMGHFGRWPIQAAWLLFVFPCLALNYLGQGAFALEQLAAAKAAGTPFVADRAWFFEMAPEAVRLPVVLLSLAATLIASQAVITGAFSLTQQAISLGLLPRMDVRRTSETQSGQIYLPNVNTFLLVGVLAVMVTFQTSANLTSAYGLAVSGTMLVTTMMATIVARRLWRWNWGLTMLFIAPLLIIDMTFLSANALRLLSGGWLPLMIASAIFLIIATWVRGSGIITDKVRRDAVPFDDLMQMLRARPPHRAPGTAIFLTGDPTTAPVALMHNLKHNKVLHERNVILTVQRSETPRVPESERVTIETLNPDFRRVTINYGFMEQPNVPKALGVCRKQGLKFDIMSTSFFLGRRSVIASATSGMPLWQDKLYIFLLKNAANPTDFFHIPAGRVVELGAQITV